MRFRPILIALSALAVAAAGLGAQSGSYAKVGEIHIGGPAAFDYLNADAAGKRLYVTHGTEVVVIDLATNAVVGRIAAGQRIHGIAIGPDNRGYISNGGDNNVSVVDLKTFQTLTRIDTGGANMNPDAILYDAKHKAVWAFNHTGKSAVEIDTATNAVVATIPLSGTAETGAVDPTLDRVFVNIEDKSVVDVIDIAARKVIATWPVAPADGPTGMAIDTATHRLFIGGGPSMVMMDARAGKVVASAPICGGTDATWFDPGTKMAFSSCGDGHITAVRENGDALTPVQTIDTERGARTMTGDTATHKLYVVAQKYGTPDANAPAPAAGQRGRGGPPAIPDSFHVLILGMSK